MKPKIKVTAVALAVAALFASPLVMAHDATANANNTQTIGYQSDNDVYGDSNLTKITDHALNHVTGNVGINLAAGSAGNQANSAALAVGTPDGDAIASANATQTNNGDNYSSSFTDNTAKITNHAFNHFTGNLGVNLASGSNINQSNGLSIAVTGRE